MNRLQHETSPYLLQHKDNPVDWYPWGEEALAKSRDEGKPILLSVGYSACHWCHVMAHESFEHEPTAKIMNELFINIKVDREERPDVDGIYMQSVQALTGRGGWPMTVFLLPDGRPFYGGTYFPLERRFGMPSFREVLTSVHNAFANRRAEVESAAEQLTDILSRNVLGMARGDDSGLDSSLLDAVIEKMSHSFDAAHGGFGGAPKFPQPMNLELMLRDYLRTGNRLALHVVTYTLTKMARGGIYDQVGGGFARYSVDAEWLVPHFEKMLYDNAQLSRLYLHAWQVTKDPFFRRIAEEIYDYILREMTAPGGGFYSATDADSEGEEGKFFVWSIEELEAILGDDANVAITYWGATPGGNFEGHNILYLPHDDDEVADSLGISVEGLREQVSVIKQTLYTERANRVPPGLDDKILTSWNGMMLASLAEAARILDRADYRDAALRCGDFLLTELVTEDYRVLRTHKEGQSKINGYLEDYAHLIDGLLELYQTSFDERWFVAACNLADHVLDQFQAEDGGFYDTSSDHETLIVRPRSVQDNAIPSGNSMIAKQLTRLAAYTGHGRYDDAARRTLELLTEAMRQYPQAFGEALNAVDMLVRGLVEIAIVGDLHLAPTSELLNVVGETFRANAIIALSPDNAGDAAVIPLLTARTQVDGKPTVYVCRNFACQMPVTTADELRNLLG